MMCLEAECQRRAYQRGLCTRHYYASRYAANPGPQRARALRWRWANIERVRAKDQIRQRAKRALERST